MFLKGNWKQGHDEIILILSESCDKLTIVPYIFNLMLEKIVRAIQIYIENSTSRIKKENRNLI